jgi:hypothetical protein
LGLPELRSGRGNPQASQVGLASPARPNPPGHSGPVNYLHPTPNDTLRWYTS